MSDNESKERILNAAKSLMDETDDISSVTMRQIARRAGVGVGLINYHYQTREKLLYEAIGEVMTGVMDAFRKAPTQNVTPVEQLKAMMISLCDIGAKHEKQMRLGAQYQLLSGDFSAANFLLPALRDAFSESKDENALRLIAFELFAMTNLMLLRTDAFYRFAGVDAMNKAQRDRFISNLIEIYIN